MESTHDILKHLINTDENAVLATIIRVEGSAYRKEGATMLFTESGSQVGIISVGCLEKDLAIRANKLLSNLHINSEIIQFDMRHEDDLAWGRGAGCNGIIHILLEKVTLSMKKNYLKLYHYLEAGIPVLAMRILDSHDDTEPFFMTDDGHVFGKYKGKIPSIMKHLPNDWQSKAGCIEVGGKSIYMQAYFPKRRLYIFGAGKDAEPLVTIANLAGFSVFIWDWREDYLKEQVFPHAAFIRSHSPEQAINQISFRKTDAVIIMTHDFQMDKQLLHLLKEQAIGYLGVLGPRHRTMRLLNKQLIPGEIHSPVGLNIDAEGPVQIAVSIIAELIQEQRKLMKINLKSPHILDRFA